MGNVNTADISITSVEEIHAFDPATGDYLWTLDELQNVKLGHSEDTTDITGKQGRLINTLKRNKALTVSGANGLISHGLLETQVGSKYELKVTDNVLVPDIVTVTNNEATTTYKAIGTTGNEIVSIKMRTAQNTLTDKEFTQDATASGSGKFAYDPSKKKLTFFAGDIPDGTEISVIYKRKIKAPVLDNRSDRYSQKAALYLDCIGEDSCSNAYHLQYYMPMSDFSGTFDIDMGDTQNAHNFEARSLASGCGATAKGTLWTLTIIGAGVEDEE